MLIHIFNSVAAELGSFGSSTGADAIDFVDCLLDSTYLASWGMSSNVVLKSFSAMETFQIDINNQRWPTGVTEPRTLDPETGTYKHWYGSNEPWDTKARDFRKALAYLANKGKWINEILKGYGHRLDTVVPIGALAGWTDYADLRSKGYLYDYNPLTAASVLDAAGFTQGTTANPYYDPGTLGSAQKLRTDPRYGGDLESLVFYIRMDDVLRRDMGRDLTAELRKAGIQVNAVETDKSVCYSQVMVLYDYHLYTGSYTNLDADIANSLYNLFHSSKYWGGTPTSHYDGTGYSNNHIGFVDATHDTWLEQCKNGGSFSEVKAGCLKAQEREAELVHSIPAYDRMGAKAVKAGWTGVINQAGWGFDNRWSFLNGINTVDTPLNPADGEIDYGFRSFLEDPNPVASEWPQDRQLINSIYDSMLGRNPYDLSMEYGFMAESWNYNSAEKYALFTLRSELTFHNGDPVTPEDVKFSIEFNKACGPGVSSTYGNMELIDHVNTATDEVGLGPRDVKVYFNSASYWALHWAGFQYILNHNVWMEANADLGWGYYRGLTDFNLFTNRFWVRNYLPWEVDSDGDGYSDYKEDGSGPFVFGDWAPRPGPITAATSVALTAFNNYAIPQSAISAFLGWAYHMCGDVNNDGRINNADGNDITRALGTDSSMLPWGNGWNQYNPDADIYTGTWDMVNHQPLVIGDGHINFLDIGMWGLYVGGELYHSSVLDVKASKSMITKGESITISVTVTGEIPESFDVTTYYGRTPEVPPDWFGFWCAGDVNRDGYINEADQDLITAALNSIHGDANWNPDADLDQDDLVSNMDLDICVSNNGLDIWTLYGQVIIGRQTVPFLQGIGKLTFTWDTEGVPTGEYTVRAYAVPSSEDQNKDDNNYGDGIVKVTNLIAVYPEITVGPPPRIDETFDLNITVAGVTDLYTWQAGLTFNPSVLEAVSVAEGEFLKGSGVPTLWTPGSIDNTLGIIHYSACSVTGANPGVDGSGQLMSITFRVKNAGDSTLHITDVLLLDSSLTSIEPVDTIDGYVKIFEEDIAVLSVVTSASEAYPSWTVPMNVTVIVENQGTKAETFDVTAYANTITIETKHVTLDPSTNTTLVFNWNLASAPESTYTIKAEASVLYGEIDTADNIIVNGTVRIKHPGDANGDDTLNAHDLGILANAWLTQAGDAHYDARADFNGDRMINTIDHEILKANWP
jgi:ABC-type transport system substrate-binding protein